MKRSRIYITVMALAVVLVFVAELNAPHRFVWKQTYDHNSREPFGTYVFDDVLSSSVKDFSLTNRTFYRILNEDTATAPRSFLVIENNIDFTKTDIESVFKLLENGNKIMLCTQNFPQLLQDTAGFSLDYGWNYDLINSVNVSHIKRDSIFIGRDALNPEKTFEVYPQMHRVTLRMETGVIKGYNYIFKTDSIINDTVEINGKNYATADSSFVFDTVYVDIDADTVSDEWYLYDYVYEMLPAKFPCEILARNKDTAVIAVRVFAGRGELFLVSTPMMFSNFGILDRDNAAYAFYLLDYLRDKPLVRLEGYNGRLAQSSTPLRYILSQPPLRWAMYAALILLLLFMAFAARRRQRVIPTVASPPNRSMNFMRLIGSLYYQRHNNAEILSMKFRYFAADIKKLAAIELTDNSTDAETEKLAEKTGMEFSQLKNFIGEMKYFIENDDVSDEILEKYIDRINEITFKFQILKCKM